MDAADGPYGAIYGLARIGEFWAVSMSTARRWLQQPEAACFSVGSMDNTGGGYGLAWYGQVNSLAALKVLMLDRRRDQAAEAARHRWSGQQCSHCEVGALSVCIGW
jgi:hypothetical protein